MESAITFDKQGNAVSFTGDAVNLFRAVTLMTSLKMMVETNGRLIPRRGFTWKKGFAIAKTYTGKDYTRKTAQQCVDDLQIWIDAMKAALPVKRQEA